MTRDMTKGSPLKLIVWFAVPVLLGNIFHQLYHMADTAIVGRYLGADALAAVGAVASLSYLIFGLVNGIAQGFGVAVSHAFGAKDERLLKHYVAVSLMMTVIVSLIVTLPVVALCRSMLIWINIPAEILPLSLAYLRIIFAGSVFTMFYNVIAGMLRAIGDSRTPLFFLVLSSVLNVGLDILFVAGFNMGTAGAAYATVLSQAVSAVLSCVYMFSRYDIMKTSRQDYYFDAAAVGKMLSIGVPMSVNNIVTASGMTVLQAAVNEYGASVMAAYTASFRVSILAMQVPSSLGVSMATYSGQNFGAKNYGRIFAGIRAAFLLNFVIAALVAAVCVFGGPLFVRLLLEDPSPEIMAYAMEYLKITSWFFVPLGWIFIYRNTLQAVGKGMVPMLSSALEFFARYAALVLLEEHIGYTAICLADPATWTSTALVLMLPYYIWAHGRKKEMKLGKQSLTELA